MKYNLTDEQISRARAKHFKNPDKNYSQILKEEKENYGVSFEDKAENLLCIFIYFNI